MKLLSLSTKILLLLSLISLYFIKSVTMSPKTISGNGNLGILFILPTVIIILLLAFKLWSDLDNLELSPKTLKYISVCSLFLLLLFCYLEYTYVLNLIDQLGGTPAQKTSRIYRFPWLNQYTNTLFFNFYTFIILISVVAGLYSVFKWAGDRH
ncbi:hypothetical protein [Neobacillus terrae]|uniref:hypothetical protein n=1 Tax=Neobacillus terrae TaxID=3034837 RepID=UPI00140D6D4B|nr:hypothetical protein [Neobacillus terrae]NHM32110.1 hypothetical protein [Neobacillus terrae]